MKIYPIFHDPGHAWVRVKRSELEELGILYDITPFSYQRNGWVYLEEDVDAGTFIRALNKAGIEHYFTSTFAKSDSKIRRYASFRLEEKQS